MGNQEICHSTTQSPCVVTRDRYMHTDFCAVFLTGNRIRVGGNLDSYSGDKGSKLRVTLWFFVVYLLTPWLYGPLRALASLITFFRIVLIV